MDHLKKTNCFVPTRFKIIIFNQCVLTLCRKKIDFLLYKTDGGEETKNNRRSVPYLSFTLILHTKLIKVNSSFQELATKREPDETVIAV